MANIITETHYASSTHGQPNTNDPIAIYMNNWHNIKNSSASNVKTAPKGSADSVYTYRKVSPMRYANTRPWTFAGLNFKFNIPSCAYIKKIRFEVPIDIDGNAEVKSPYARFNIYGGTKSVATNIKNNKGWDNGYYYAPSNVKNLTKLPQTHVYEISGEEFHKRGYPASSINSAIFGIDLMFHDATKMKQNYDYLVHIKYVKCVVTYEMADEVITFDRVTTGDNPRVTTCGKWYSVDVKYQNKSNASCCNETRQFKISGPPNATISGVGNNYNDNTKIWTVRCKPHALENLGLTIRDYGSGLNKINIKDVSSTKNWNYWVYSSPASYDVGEVKGYTGVMQKDRLSCITFESKVNSPDGVADYYIKLCNRVLFPSGQSPTIPVDDVTWTLDTKKSSAGVSWNDSSTNTHVKINVPQNEVVNVVFTACFVPDSTGDRYATVELGSPNNNNYEQDILYTVIDAPIYVVRNTHKLDKYDRTTDEITFNPSVINFRTHRVATSTEIGAYVIDCGIADLDANMIEEGCTVSGNVWEKIDYIGCVPLHYHHYDPDSTYSNKGISESYKNKTYKGKEGVIDEKISLKFKAKPKEVPTLQGLVKLDKPTPINANWRCFEGDPLNHRGWVVLSQIKAKRTNPLWYDCEAEVDYITHDITTKFQIFKQLQVNTVSMPKLLAETFELGSNLSTGLHLFSIDTDGGFVYDEDGEEGARNIFSLDEGQHLHIASKRALSDISQIRFDWYSNMIQEKRENNIERVFRLKDSNGNVVFEYEYTNLTFYEDYVTCDIIVRVKTEGEGWDIETYRDVDLRTEIEVDPIADDGDDATEEIITGNTVNYYYYDENNDEYVLLADGEDYDGELYIYDSVNEEYVLVGDEEDTDEPAYDPEYIAPSFDPTKYDVTTVYGTSTEFVIESNKVSVYEAGYNGAEVTIEDISLLKSNSYSFETMWINHNADGNTEDVLSYIDLGLSETLISTEYAQYYKNLMVSPFPIPYKTVAFTRESEEGTIFYLTGSEPFKYRIEPYYQFHCGCDLVTREGGSIFDLNNSYTYFYIENGLVRLGFNKFNHRLYLAKWDIVSKDWVTTHYFHMADNIKFSLESYSDDKIVIKAGTSTFFTIWRGHPFIGIKNPKDNIYIDTTFNYCLSDKVEGQIYDYPIIHSFLNTNNLLPECVGGTILDSDCIDVFDDEITSGTNHTLTLSKPSPNPQANTNCVLDVTLDPTTTDGSVHYLINNIDVATVEYPFDLTYKFQKPGDYVVQAVYVGDEDDNIAISEKVVVKVEAPPVRPNSPVANNPQHTAVAGEYNLKIVSAPSKFTYKDGKQVWVQLTKGGTPMKGYPIELQTPTGVTATTMTDRNGKAKITNTHYKPGTYQWGARFYDATDADHNRKLVLTALKMIEIEKATPTLSYNAVNGKVNKGKPLNIKLRGVDAPLTGKKLTFSVNGGKKTKLTNKYGNIHVYINTKGTFKIKVMYAGDKFYKGITKTFTVKVV